MRRFIKHIILAFLSLGFFSASYATIDIELTQGIAGTIPIVVVPFQAQGLAPENLQNVTAVIAHDFTNSGRLKPLVQELASLDVAAMEKLGSNYAVKGEVTPAANGQVTVHYTLFQANPLKSTTLNILLSETFTVQTAQLRALGHRISDAIYQKLTNERGIFSTRIAYINVIPGVKKRYILEVSDYDGVNARALLNSSAPILSPAWSPDGRKLAYVSFEKGKAQIYISDVATGNRRLITDFAGINGAPAFSPDGTKLAVALSKQEAQPHIYVISLLNGVATQLTHGWSIDTEPAFSPDGQFIIFTSDRGGAPQIYQMPVSGGSATRLTYEGNYNASASFSLDGKQVVLLHRATNAFNIALLDLTSGRVFELTHSDDNESPSLAPNGSLVLYATRQNGKRVLAMVSTDGRMQWRLPARMGNVQEPAWSPFLS